MSGRVELQGHWPAAAPTGTCVIKRLDDPLDGTRLWIDHADPQIMVSAELLDEISRSPSPGVSLKDGVLRIVAENRTVIYRIGEYFAAIHAYAAEWPD
jgi:hypothetical protein